MILCRIASDPIFASNPSNGLRSQFSWEILQIKKLPREKRVFLAFCRILFGSLHISKFTVFTLFAHQIELLPASKTSPLIMVSLMTSHTMTLTRTTIMKMTLMISPSWSGFTALVPVVCQHKCSKYKTIKCALVPVLCQQTGILFSVTT